MLLESGEVLELGLKLWLERGGFPESRRAAAFAETEDAVVGGADVGFDAGVVHFFQSLARIADEREEARFGFDGRERRKLEAPKVQVGIDEGHAVGVAAGVRAELADDSDLRFRVAIGQAKDQLLFGRKFVLGNDAGAVEAEEDGFGGLRKNATVEIAADQEDGNFFRDAAAAAHNLLWQECGQSGVRSGPIKYLRRMAEARVFQFGTVGEQK